MLNIRPVSDLRNNYPQIEDIVVNKKEPVFLTKNGYGSVVVIDLEEYDKMKNIVEIIENDEICRLLDEATEEARKNPKRLKGKEVFAKARRIANGEKL